MLRGEELEALEGNTDELAVGFDLRRAAGEKMRSLTWPGVRSIAAMSWAVGSAEVDGFTSEAVDIDTPAIARL
jgi:hypothetical protein